MNPQRSMTKTIVISGALLGALLLGALAPVGAFPGLGSGHGDGPDPGPGDNETGNHTTPPPPPPDDNSTTNQTGPGHGHPPAGHQGGLLLTPENQTRIAGPGDQVTYQFVVRNQFHRDVVVRLEASDPPDGWHTSLGAESIEVPGEANATFNLTVDVPVVPLGGLEAHIQVQVSLIEDPDVSDSSWTRTRYLV